ncbi:hypothetical protein [Cryptosporangium sp. NPDC051539]|uniref:hypothetical protein n=1 Tax=Cryptosporangium sp. NPDC051539 TaxID=3363962 RepID=UPI00379550DD
MRALRHSDERCPDCRGGLVGAEPWEAWFARCDEVPSDLRDERPDCDEEVDCPSCGGTGLRRPLARKHAA